MVRAKWNMNPTTMTMTKTKAIINPDEYYQRSEVSNSDLTELKNQLHPHMQYGDREAAFRFGSIRRASDSPCRHKPHTQSL